MTALTPVASAPLGAFDPARSRAAARALRREARAGRFAGQTAGQAPGAVQANLAVLPRDWADEFLRFCQRNPKPCPVLAVGEPGDPALPALGEGIDLRTDLPAYCVFRDGALVSEVTDLRDVWRDDLVAFAIGCSFSFEEALVQAGVPLWHLRRGCDVAVYRTSVPCRPAGRFGGNLIVSMRPFSPADAIRAVQVTSRFPNVHGAPVHFGDPGAIGVADIDRPDFGPRQEIAPGQVPVFWACGVTPRAAIEHARPPLAITHKPGHMLATDLLNAELASL
jgi:uncharacterized protein YcsI (UPF0317 family)